MAANSTVMYQGIDPAGRNSSKVLAPPGGRSSIGFGPCEDELVKPAPQEVEQELEAPAPCQDLAPAPCQDPAPAPCQDPETSVEPEAKVQEAVAPPPENMSPPRQQPQEEGGEEGPTEPHTPAMGPAGRVAEVGTPGGRVKVPPGGFSSGAFWSVGKLEWVAWWLRILPTVNPHLFKIIGCKIFTSMEIKYLNRRKKLHNI